MEDRGKNNFRYEIVSQRISPYSNRSSLGIFDHQTQQIFDVPVRLIIADDDFISHLSQSDVRFATIIHEQEKNRLAKTLLVPDA